MPTDKPRYTITLDEEMLKKIDDFRFENRFPNRTQATLELIRLGLETLENELKNNSVVDNVDKTVDNETEIAEELIPEEHTIEELEEEYKKTLHSASKTNSTVLPTTKETNENTKENKVI